MTYELSLSDRMTGYIGTAEPAEPLNEDEDEEITTINALSTEDLSLVTKFAIFAVIVGACYAFVRSRTPRQTGFAGRHGAYEKGALP